VLSGALQVAHHQHRRSVHGLREHGGEAGVSALARLDRTDAQQRVGHRALTEQVVTVALLDHAGAQQLVEREERAAGVAAVDQLGEVLDQHVRLGLPQRARVVARQREAERERARVVAERAQAALEHRVERRRQRLVAQVPGQSPLAALVAGDPVVDHVLRVLHAGLRTALRELVQPGRRVVETRTGSEQRLQQLARVLRADRRELDPALGPAQLLERGRCVREHGRVAGGHEQQPAIGGEQRQATEHAERRGVGAVHVVDGDQHALAARGHVHQIHERGAQLERAIERRQRSQRRLAERAMQRG
jgi:hypothetical protein